MINYTPEMTLIPISQEQFAIIDRDDIDLAQFNWSAVLQSCGGERKYHASRSVPKEGGKYTSTGMHRVILSRILNRDLTTRDYVDHINGNPLDNRRANLRLSTPAQNALNRGKNHNTTSPYKGVYRAKGTSKWYAQITKDGKRYQVTGFSTAEQAFEIYCALGSILHGEFFNSGEKAA